MTSANTRREMAGLLKAMDEAGLKEGTIVTTAEQREERLVGKRIAIVPYYLWAAQGETS